DDLAFFINQVARRLEKFEGTGGNLTIDWLDQFAASAADKSKEGGQGDGLFCLLRDAAGGQGFLDRLAGRQARQAIANGTLISQLDLTPSLLLSLASVMGLTPDRRFDALSPAIRAEVRELYLKQRLGRISVDYPTSTDTSTTFFDLLNVKLS